MKVPTGYGVGFSGLVLDSERSSINDYYIGATSHKALELPPAEDRYKNCCGFGEDTPTLARLKTLTGKKVTFIWGDPVRITGVLVAVRKFTWRRYVEILLDKPKGARVWLDINSIFSRTLKRVR